MDSITLSFDTYVDAAGNTVGGDTGVYSTLGVRGFDDIDELSFWPALSKTLLDGSQSQTNLKAARIITVDFGVIQTKADRVWLMKFFMAPVKELICASPSETVEVVMESADGVSNEWLEGLSMARAFTIRFKEKVPFAPGDTPAAWA
jgi:hypothetical protein